MQIVEQLLPGTRAELLDTGVVAARTTVCGVEVESATNARELIAADLVLDSTGRAGLATKWLEELGFRPPPESQVRIEAVPASGCRRKEVSTQR
jgi:hypothetical protein